MGTMGWPDFNQFVNECWGWSWEVASGFPVASNFVFGKNPPYYLDDFLSVYPNFFGPPTVVAGAGTTNGSQSVTLPGTNGLAVNQFVQGSGLPKGTIITALGNNQITVSNQATATQSSIPLTVYEAPPVPTTVIQIYINLAVASLVQARWQDAWFIAISWFVAHYCTLFAKSASKVTTILEAALHSEVPAVSGTFPATVFTLSIAPPGGVIDLFLNGVFQNPGGDNYTLNGSTITMTTPVISTDTLRANWSTQIPIQTSGFPNAAQLAAQGIANGIQVSKSVGDVSESFTPLSSLEAWGTLNLTIFGQELADMARVIGSGPALIWVIPWLLVLGSEFLSQLFRWFA